MHPDQEPVDPNKPKWLSYEELATYLLNRMAKEFGLESVQGKQKIQGKRCGTSWVIDAKGIIEGGGGFFIVECRRYTTSKQNQEKVGGLAYRILDTGANGAILVSQMGLQEGGEKIAAAENILSVELDENSTPTDFALKFLNKLYLGITMRSKATMTVVPRLVRACSKCDKTFTPLGSETLCKDCAG
jgi:hypothetical protein